MNQIRVMNSLNHNTNSLIPLMKMSSKIVSFKFILNIFFKDFSNPLKRKEFDRKRLHQQMREIQSVSLITLLSYKDFYSDRRFFSRKVWVRQLEAKQNDEFSAT